MNKALRRKLFIVSIILIVILAIIYGFLPKKQQVDLVGVTRGPLQITIEEEGRTRLKDRFTISAPTAGYMRRIDAKVGDPVKKGQIVAVLEPLRLRVEPRFRLRRGVPGLWHDLDALGCGHGPGGHELVPGAIGSDALRGDDAHDPLPPAFQQRQYLRRLVY